MSGLLKKFSRSRGNSASYVDDDYHRSPTSPTAPGQAPPSSYHSPANLRGDDAIDTTLVHPNDPHSASSIEKPMYAPSAGAAGGYAAARPQPMRASRGQSSAGDSGFADGPASPIAHKETGYTTPGGTSTSHGGGAGGLGAPDLLTRAFNEAIRPYTEKIEMLEAELQDMNDYVRSQDSQRMELFAWIDKRGLRPDVPAHIAAQMDSASHPTSAELLNQQLDRKITIVNFDLHRLQDDLNDSISSAHFASAMAKFIPDIQRLCVLPGGGARFAYELIIKLVGNLIIHGGLEAVDGAESTVQSEIDEDRRARVMFFQRMDDELVKVVHKRGSAGRSGEADGPDWGKAGLGGEVKRLEKSARYQKDLGHPDYFPRTLDVMRRELQMNGGGGAMGSSGGGYNTPPGYSRT